MTFDLKQATDDLTAALADVAHADQRTLDLHLLRAYNAGRAARPLEPRPQLTRRQLDVYNYIVQHMIEHGTPPSMRQIGAALEMRSTASVSEHMDALVEKGWVRRGERKDSNAPYDAIPPRIEDALRVGWETSWPLSAVLQTLVRAGDILLDELDHDGHGWELIRGAVRAGAGYLAGQEPSTSGHDCGPPTPALLELRKRMPIHVKRWAQE
jgi:hypothetical protein